MSESLSPAAYPRRTCLAIVLAAGQGTRMRSRRPKALHQVAGRSMLAAALAAVSGAGADHVVVVVGPDHDALAAEARKAMPDVGIAVQTDRRGTAHAVLAAREAIAAGFDDILVAFADTPLVRTDTFSKMRVALACGETAVVCLGFEARDPTGYGRLVMKDGVLDAIREDRDASDEERKLTLCNAGLMGIAGRSALQLLDAIGCENSQREYYLSDIVAAARALKLAACALIAPAEEVMGVNDRVQLAAAEAATQARLRSQAMLDGATLVDPASVTFAYDTALGQDVVVEPSVVFGPGVVVAAGARVRAFSHLEGTSVGENAIVGPFARLRPGTRLAEGARIGNFVETKAAEVGAGAKINHLSYVGDASVGAKANVGAGTITCNYDGFGKHRTQIGAGAFIGSNTLLVAPVVVGEGAIVGAGTVVTEDVAADALALARAQLAQKPGWAARFRKKKGG
ncbi:bifunctional UDP-N-acetylglucosamine diphosphorylase/glucosamine-1-phosphate N-acetyltransferase GlmU [Methylocella sp.]|uniref:bifunctional UDP-N-acetylglucosamine diphosphorylase/glucosamine-1-phosphate N-acetyltransferase GlmU n=1 Tax=Methylocella sp. TaxID=1978226 RepID=UPI0037852E8B